MTSNAETLVLEAIDTGLCFAKLAYGWVLFVAITAAAVIMVLIRYQARVNVSVTALRGVEPDSENSDRDNLGEPAPRSLFVSMSLYAIVTIYLYMFLMYLGFFLACFIVYTVVDRFNPTGFFFGPIRSLFQWLTETNNAMLLLLRNTWMYHALIFTMVAAVMIPWGVFELSESEMSSASAVTNKSMSSFFIIPVFMGIGYVLLLFVQLMRCISDRSAKNANAQKILAIGKNVVKKTESLARGVVNLVKKKVAPKLIVAPKVSLTDAAAK